MRLMDIEELCNSEQNFPGIVTQIAVIDACGVTAIPAADVYDPDESPSPTTEPHSITTALTIKSGYAFVKWNFRGKSEATYTTEVVGEADAETVNASVKGYIPKLSSLRDYILCRPNGRFIVLVWTRNDDDPYLIGEIGNGCRLKVTQQTSPKNGYILDLYAENLDIQPYKYTGSIDYTF